MARSLTPSLRAAVAVVRPGMRRRADRKETMKDQDRPFLDPSPGWVSQDRHAGMTLVWFAAGVALGIILGWGVFR